MSKVEYEMSVEYCKNLVALPEFIEAREVYRKELKLLPPWIDGHKVRTALAELDKKIDLIEKSLAAEYETVQAEKLFEAKLSKAIADGWQLSKELYLIVKSQTPHLLDDFTEKCLSGLTPELLKEFFDDAATLEATKSVKILGNKKNFG